MDTAASAMDGPSMPELELLLREIRAYEAENFMMETALGNIDEAVADTYDTDKDKVTTKRGGKKKEVKAVPQSLSLQQKSHVVQQVLEEQKRTLRKQKHDGDSMVFDLNVELDALEEAMSIQNLESIALKQAFSQYEQADGTRLGAPANKMISYLEEQLRRKDSELDKLLTKQKMLKGQVVKARQAAAEQKHKEEGGESLKPIDFDQLQIDNNKLLDTIESRNAQVMALKATAGAAQRQLNNVKQDLLDTQQSTAWLVKTKNEKKAQLTNNIAAEAVQVAKVVDKEKAVNRKLLASLETANAVPAVLEYVQQGVNLTTLRKQLKNYETKVEITSGQLKQLRTRHKKMMTHSSGAAGAYGGSSRRLVQRRSDDGGFSEMRQTNGGGMMAIVSRGSAGTVSRGGTAEFGGREHAAYEGEGDERDAFNADLADARVWSGGEGGSAETEERRVRAGDADANEESGAGDSAEPGVDVSRGEEDGVEIERSGDGAVPREA